MIRIYKYDIAKEYTDFENYIFTNLSSSYFDLPNDKVTLDAVDYRISTAYLFEDDNDGNNNGSEYIRDAYSSRFHESVSVTTVEDALDQIFMFTSIAPNISISFAPANSLRELGNDVVNPSITGNAILGQNPQGTLAVMEFFRGTTGGMLFDSEINPTPSTSISKQDTFTIVNNQAYTVRITDSEGRTDTATLNYNFTYPYFTGWVDESGDIMDGMTRAEIIALSGMNLLVATKSNKTVVSSPTNGRFCIMYPASYGALSEVIDNTGFDTITDYDTFTYDIVGLDGTTQSYRVYILKNDTTQSNFSNAFNF